MQSLRIFDTRIRFEIRATFILTFLSLLFSALFAQILVFGCVPGLEPYKRQGRSRILSKENDLRVNVDKIFSLNRQGETASVRPNFSTRSGQSIYGR